ncbi:glycerol-3-phosphate dehydrogenase/oxidase [Microbacterium sp. p3-SID336]|uniref:glycerol-3-phosphate dehydrogenase/oxidase n=1 Tax=Microbacterium sp. p3-SID336 TaxID=2916212 RepID=UPI0021A2C025|nr:glycerol-3-phosphate dehydrogenase/oxidase [Microbacterium sp. p3-SID336]MCT1479065.1 glycerol-3-phosphate dehydrogenase/oxidase [Microbacterium sp. p3-SID336]
MTDPAAALNAARRSRDLAAAVDETCDVLVVGGGITGVGVALDAAARGLRVTLVEAEDLAWGTSRFSSKLVHGGLRYLATGDVATAVESARERHLLMTTIAPHLIRPLPQLLPFAPGVSARQRSAGTAGMAMGDVLRLQARTPRRVLPPPRLLGPRQARALFPALTPRGLRGGVLGHDGQLVDDAALVVAVARTAAAHGARILTRVRAEALRADGATVVDTLGGGRFDLRARSVVNATGVWAGTLDDGIRVRPSRGTHVVLDAADLGRPRAALTVPLEGSISQYVFVLPHAGERVIVGLTDEDAPGAIPRVPAPTEAEIAFLLATVNRLLAAPLDRTQVRGAFAGLRPLVDNGASSSADVSRRHLVRVASAGFVSVLGGKLTTYRRMAEDAVDLALRTRRIDAPPSTTASLMLVDDQPSRWERMADQSSQRPSRAEIEFAVRAEGALTADDVLDRRTRIGLVDAERDEALPLVETVVAETLDLLR